MVDDMQSVMAGCLSGNETAWSAFFTEYAPIAMNILSHRLGDLSLDEKEDIIQNTFSKLLKGGLKNFRGSTRYEFLAYFRRIVLNEALTYLKSGREWKDTASLDQERDRDQPESPQLEVHDGNPEAYAGAKKHEQLQIITTVLEGSPVETKQVVLMKMEGYKDREIADILGISPGTVASKYSRIKERVRKLLGRTISG
jgi:RNA polymerase sigma factor (sigma-70 family)